MLKFYSFPLKENKERKPSGAIDTSLDLLSKYLLIIKDFRFDVMLYSILGSENSDAAHIKCSRGPRVPHPCA